MVAHKGGFPAWSVVSGCAAEQAAMWLKEAAWESWALACWRCCSAAEEMWPWMAAAGLQEEGIQGGWRRLQMLLGLAGGVQWMGLAVRGHGSGEGARGCGGSGVGGWGKEGKIRVRVKNRLGDRIIYKMSYWVWVCG